jgi:hypothetical protein
MMQNRLKTSAGVIAVCLLGIATNRMHAAAEHNLDLKSQGNNWSEVRLRRVRLVPAQ